MSRLALRNLLVRVGADISGLSKGMKDASKQIESFGNRLNKAMGGIQGKLGGALAGLGAGMYLKDAMSDAIKYEALMGTLTQTMGESINGFMKWQDAVGASMGFSKLQGAELANMLSLNFKSIATSTEDLMTKTTDMMELAAVISNKRGMAMSEVSDRIRSAMNQEADGAMELGVDVRIAAIQTSNAYKMLANNAPWDSLSEGMRKTILYHHIFEQVSKNLGTTLQQNTQIYMSQFTSALGDVRLALGQAFLPILNIVLPVLTAFMRKIQQALQWVSAFSRALFGKGKAAGGSIGSKKSMDSAASGIQNTGVALGNMGSSAGKASKGVGKASKAVKDLASNLQGFDEVNLIEEPKAPSGGAGGAGGGGGVGGGAGGAIGGGGGIIPEDAFLPLQDGTTILDKAYESATKLANKFRDFFAQSEGWKTLKEGVTGLWDSLKDFWNSPVISNFRQAFAEDLPDFFSDLGTIGGGTFKTIGGAVDFLNGIINRDFSKSMEGAGEALFGVWDIASGTIGLLFPDLGNKMSEFGDKFEKKWKWFQENFVEGSDNLEEVVTKLGIYISAWVVQKIAEMKEKAITKIVQLITEWKKKFENIKLALGIIMEAIKENIKTKAEDAKEKFLKPFKSVAKWFEDNVSDPIKKSFENITKGFDKGVGSGLKSIFNEAIGKINGFIKTINGLTFAGWSPSIPTISPLKLAKGGITNGPTLAMVGDNPGGREVVSPLDKLQGFVTNAVIEAMNLNGGGTGGSDIVLNIDGRQFARIVKPFIDKENHRIGTNVKLNSI